MGGYIVIAPAVESFGTALACMSCGDQRKHALNRVQLNELRLRGELRLYCSVCGTGTSWNSVQVERRSGRDRRASPQPRLVLPVRIRCNHGGLEFTQVTTTLTASRKGASFVTHHPLPPGTPISVILPYDQADPSPLESPARVAWSERHDDAWEVGIELLR